MSGVDMEPPAVGKKYQFREYPSLKTADLITVEVVEVVELGDGKTSIGYERRGLKEYMYVDEFRLNAEVQT
ncbi:hypothetical protein [Pseudarthrobacter sp. ATCC 49987]|uniref:hypothetical protein n=1 Tax=Pseudarthrobacter sp. ATCC 49987 TaxID=2698204 RepID=UPI001372147D|nr:hypothetical protein [Pseudarthrobacter sp. ATCC 49987]